MDTEAAPTSGLRRHGLPGAISCTEPYMRGMDGRAPVPQAPWQPLRPAPIGAMALQEADIHAQHDRLPHQNHG
jgi:hypothetical protein